MALQQQDAPKEDPKPAEPPKAAIPPASAAAQAAAARLEKLRGILFKEAKAVASDEKLKGIFQQYYGVSEDGNYLLVPLQKPEDVLNAIQRIQELSPEIGARLKKDLSALNAEQEKGLNVKLPAGIQRADDPYLASKDPAQVIQRLKVLKGFLDQSAGSDQELYRKIYATHTHQLVGLLEPAETKPKSEDLRVLAVEVLSRLGSPYADGAREKLAALKTEDAKLLKARDEALKVLAPASPTPAKK